MWQLEFKAPKIAICDVVVVPSGADPSFALMKGRASATMSVKVNEVHRYRPSG